MSAPRLGKVGIWSAELRFSDKGETAEAAAELEELGYDGLWMPGVFGGDIFPAMRHILDATKETTVASGIVNVWAHTPEETAAAHADLTAAHPGRVIQGIGISHKPLVDQFKSEGTYQKPLGTIGAYLDGMDAASTPVPKDERCVAALKPKMRALSAERTLGTHSYFVTPDHTRTARETMGDALVAPEQTVVLIEDPEKARATARAFASLYIGLPNYVNNLKDHGFEDADFADGGSDRMIDAVIAWGSAEKIAARVKEHLDAGADHVCIQVVPEGYDPKAVIAGTPQAVPIQIWRDLAPAVTNL